MGLFETKECCNCGKPVKMLSGVALSGDLKLCGDCSSVISANWYKNAAEWNLDDFGACVNYMNDEDKRMAQFTKTHQYGSLLLDVGHGLFFVDEGLFRKKPADNIIYDMRYVDGLDYYIEPENYKEGIVSDRITAKCHIILSMAVPNIDTSYIISYAMTCPLKTSGIIFTKVEDVLLPDDWQEFYTTFLEAVIRFREERIGNADSLSNVDDVELTKALATFMFSDISEVTEDALKHQRNKLIKAFHTDNGEDNTKSAQRINEAYAVIRTALDKNTSK